MKRATRRPAPQACLTSAQLARVIGGAGGDAPSQLLNATKSMQETQLRAGSKLA